MKTTAMKTMLKALLFVLVALHLEAGNGGFGIDHLVREIPQRFGCGVLSADASADQRTSVRLSQRASSRSGKS